jgi:hypothetical protein
LTSPPNFDRIARPYRWLEYLTLGRSLERAREVFLPLLKDRRQALILGDGDGRFTARLLAQTLSPSVWGKPSNPAACGCSPTSGFRVDSCARPLGS